MEKQKTTGDLLDILKNNGSCAEIQQEIMSERITDSLADVLNALVAQRNIKPADVMRKSGLKKAYFYSLLDGSRTNPSRDVLIQLGFGFEMSFEEVQEFLKHRGAAQLYPRIPRDGVIIYCFQRKMCDILLSDNGEPLLTKE